MEHGIAAAIAAVIIVLWLLAGLPALVFSRNLTPSIGLGIGLALAEAAVGAAWLIERRFG